MADYLTYQNIEDAIERLLKLGKGSKQTSIKELINMVYLDELLVADDLYPLFWLLDLDDTLDAVDPASVAGISIANPGVITTSAAHGIPVGGLFSLHDIVGTVEMNNRIFRAITGTTGTTLNPGDLDGTAINTSGYTAWSSGGTVHHRGMTLATTGKNVERLLSAQFQKDNTRYDPMEAVGPDEIDWTNVTGRPAGYHHRKAFTAAGVETNQIIWTPGCDDNYDFRYWFEQRVSPLSAAGNVPILPPRFHNAIIAGVATRLIESGAQVENAVVWPGIYRSQINALITHNRKFWEAHDKDRRPEPYLL